jgi:hypothetical protein
VNKFSAYYSLYHPRNVSQRNKRPEYTTTRGGLNTPQSIKSPTKKRKNTIPETEVSQLSFDAHQEICNFVSSPPLESFHSFCNRNTSAFGRPGSNLRRKCQNRRQYYQTKLHRFKTKPLTEFQKDEHSLIINNQLLPSRLSFDDSDDNKSTVTSLETMAHRSLSKSELELESALSESHDEVYTLNFKIPERNKGGLLCFRCPNAQINGGNQLVDVIFILKPIYDIRDHSGPNRVKARILPDGSGIVVTEPIVPNFLIHNLKEIWSKEEDEDRCPQCIIQHSATANSIKLKSKRQTKTTTMKFPSDVKCLPGFFNKKTDGTIDTHVRVIETAMPGATDVDDPNLVLYYLFWKVQVDMECKVITLLEEEEEDEMALALKSMSRMKVSK